MNTKHNKLPVITFPSTHKKIFITLTADRTTAALAWARRGVTLSQMLKKKNVTMTVPV